MEVFLIPVGPGRYEMYCELPEEDPLDHPADHALPSGLIGRMVARFRVALAAAERERRRRREANWPHDAGAHSSPYKRVKSVVFRWLAEAIAEQRLLWQLRRTHEACLVYPADMSEAEADAVRRAHLRRDMTKHRWWLGIDGLALIASGALMLVPGPNLVAYYFAFRVVGHFLSLRGATAGLQRVHWTFKPSSAVAELRSALQLAPTEREARVKDVATRLRLAHLASFFERTAAPPA